MHTLFPDEPVFPDGFTYTPAFLTVEEEAALYAEILNTDLQTMVFHGFEAKRKVASFGYSYSFQDRSLNKAKEIPAAFNFLIQKTGRSLHLPPDEFTQLLITEYPPGSVINWRRDAPPFKVIAGISLMEDCTFRLRPYQNHDRSSIISLFVERRSLYCIRGNARSNWEHSTAPVKNVRYSVTLRTLTTTAYIDRR